MYDNLHDIYHESEYNKRSRDFELARLELKTKGRKHAKIPE